MRTQELIAHIAQWLKAYATGEGMTGFVVGVSGGVDSAVVSALCGHTGMPSLSLYLPIAQGTDEDARARDHLAWLQARFPQMESTTVDLTEVFAGMDRTLGAIPLPADLAMARVNLKSRLRLCTLYYAATATQRLVVGTANRTEQQVGFFAKYGDVDMDLNPIAGLSKSEVYELAAALGVAERIRHADPTDGLWPDGRTDRDQIGAGYGELDWALEVRTAEQDTRMMGLTARQHEVLRIYDERHRDNTHKLEPPPRCPIPFRLRLPPAPVTEK